MKALNKNHSLKRLLFLLIFASVFAACTKDDVDPKKEFDYLTESQLIATVNKVSILSFASFYPDVYDIIKDKDLFDVGVFKIKYKTTDVAGAEIIASGAILIPITDGPVPLMSYQHGSLFNPNDAPSKFSSGEEVKSVGTIFASAGYAVVMPDYLGYGESSSYPHPYEHTKSLGSASFDMLMAAKEFLEDDGTELTDKLFITGYSEGGNATMALHQHIEENSDLEITMSAPASGAYNKTEFVKAIIETNENLAFLPRYMWVLDSYNWVYSLGRNWSDFVNASDAAKLDAITDPMQLKDADIALNPQSLFQPDFIQALSNETDTEFMNALADNDIFDWTPTYPITLYYGTADDYVFPINSETAYDALLTNGATVTKVSYEGKDHSTAFIPYLIDVFELFESLK